MYKELESQTESKREREESCISHTTLRAPACLMNLPYTGGTFGSARVAEIFGVAFGVALRRPRGQVVATRIVGVAVLLPFGTPLGHIG